MTAMDARHWDDDSVLADLRAATDFAGPTDRTVEAGVAAFTWRTMTVLGVKKTQMQSARFVWRLPPEDHGGLMAKDFETLMAQVDRSLDEPDCCRDATREFLDRHMLGADGQSNERILGALRDLVAA